VSWAFGVSRMRSKRQKVIISVLLGVVAYVGIAFVLKIPPVGCIYIGQSLENCRACLKQVEMAKAILESDKNWTAGHEINESDIKEACGYIPKCPGGGKYTFNKIGDPPACSLAGTTGPTPRKQVVGLIFWNWAQPPSAPHEL